MHTMAPALVPQPGRPYLASAIGPLPPVRTDAMLNGSKVWIDAEWPQEANHVLCTTVQNSPKNPFGGSIDTDKGI